MPTRWELSKEEARTLATVIAEHIDAVADGKRHTAVVEAQREDAAAPHLVFIVTMRPEFIGPLLEFCKHHPAAQLWRLPAERIAETHERPPDKN
jgi:hypothetical protein